ncbi:MAG: ABC transporter ATP-binding protein [Pseudomonadota bacterium]
MGISVEGLIKSFGAHRAVDDVCFEVETGSLFAIVGESGCGKSTLLRLLAGLETPDVGEIRLDGETVSGEGAFVPPEDRQVGFVFQSYALWPHLTVLGNVAFPAQAKGATRAEAEAAARDHLDTVALAGFAARQPQALSGGQRQRVALARCLAGGARVVLMDEPLANLDPHLRGAMERELLRFHRAQGTTTVYITHDQREAMALADRMAVMRAGRFLQTGAPQDIFERPVSAEVARFIGRGAVLPVTLEGAEACFAGLRVPCDRTDGLRDGPALALIRPQDCEPGDGLAGQVSEVHYRGGAWEARVAVDRLPEAFEVTLRQPVRSGAPLSLRVTRCWAMPPE